VVAYESLDHVGFKVCLISIWWQQRLKCFIHVKSQFREKNSVLSIGKFPSLVLPRNAMMLQHLIIQFSLYYLSSGRLREVKNKRNFKLLTLKVVAVVHERWWLTRGSKYSDLTWKRLYFGKLVAAERWSQPEVRLYLVFSVILSELCTKMRKCEETEKIVTIWFWCKFYTAW